MRIDVNGTRLWFDVDGPVLVPEGAAMVERPVVILIHGGPGGYDHSYFKPHFAHLASAAQVVYVDLRDHGRSMRHRAADWSFELCADDLAAFVAALGIADPVVLGHSMGGFVAILLAARHPEAVGALVLQSTMARFDLARLTEGFRRVAGDETADLARREYGGEQVTDAEWARIFAAFGPVVPGDEELARRIRNPSVGAVGMDLLRALDITADLALIRCPTLVCVGDLDPVTPVEAAAELSEGLHPGRTRVQIVDGAGHFPWLERPDFYWPVITDFIRSRR
jgi:pimeloyl-ACP methyl ester carboxylesterase